METSIADFRLRLTTLPQPVALALGRICRHPDKKELIEASLKASEVLARYLTALAMSAFCARDEAAGRFPNELMEFRGNLSFGHFLSALKAIARNSVTFPLKSELEAAFRVGSDGEKAFDKLILLRNKLGHRLSTISAATAEQVLQRDQPVQCLWEALKACQGLLNYPLFLLEEQRIVKKVVLGRRLLLMGDGEPTPDFIELESPLGEDRALYLGMRNGALRLPPFLVWDIVEARGSYGLYLLHRIQPKGIEYLTVHDEGIEQSAALADFDVLLAGMHRPIEAAALKEGGNFLSEWATIKKFRVELAQPLVAPIPWSDLNEKTLAWFDAMLKGGAKPEEKQKKPGSVMVKMLLDGREILSTNDLRQIVLLFGKEKVVSSLVKRPLVDCRARKLDSEQRWDERKESSANVFDSLKTCIEFFTRHLAVEGATLDGFKATTGTADYIAMREALVNLFIHQDYTHSGMAGQVEIRENQTLFFNPGKSLVPLEGILDGGKSTSRNPVVSRAMRLVGFAELAGSGLFAVRNEWRKTRGVAPKIESNVEANTFALTFDWVPSVQGFDEYWKEKLGVKLTSSQASILSALGDGPLTGVEIGSAVSMNAADTNSAIQHLAVQTLIIEEGGKYSLRSDILQLLPKFPLASP